MIYVLTNEQQLLPLTITGTLIKWSRIDHGRRLVGEQIVPIARLSKTNANCRVQITHCKPFKYCKQRKIDSIVIKDKLDYWNQR